MNAAIGKEINTITQALIRHYRPQEIVLFGSAARGRFTPGSDLDFLIVKATRKSPLNRVREVIEFLPNTVDTEVIVLTPQELAARRKEGNYFITEISKYGKTLYRKTDET